MPGRDRTGPGGMGAMTGRGAGACGGGTQGFGRGAGFGAGRGGRGGGPGAAGGRGWRRMFHATGLFGWERGGRIDATAGELKQQASALEQALEFLRARIRGLEGVASKPPAGEGDEGGGE